MLNWLAGHPDWDGLLVRLKDMQGEELTSSLRELASSRMDFTQSGKLDRVLMRMQQRHGPLPGLQPFRLALLASSTTSHLVSGIRLAGLRIGLSVEVYEAGYGMYWQELMDDASSLQDFRPQALLLALDAHHLAASQQASSEAAVGTMRACWHKAKASFACQVIQQTVLPVFPRLLGSNEVRLAQSPASVVQHINDLLRASAETEEVDLLALDDFAAVDGIRTWHDASMWHRSKHEVHPRMAQHYGDQVMRVVGAARGASAKCLVLDLDNTLWGGAVGDEGLQGIVLGPGSGEGEAFTEFQRYARRLKERGVLLAVCSKNDEQNALEVFDQHPEMVLQASDISCFVANWDNKAANLRLIAHRLNIGTDALVFVDDNPAERALVRRELPEVRVPELPVDPAEYAATIFAAGYFEGLRVTDDDGRRTQQYRENASRSEQQEAAIDMDSYLRSLTMQMEVGPFDSVHLGRVTQLINKTNQFNLTTERLNQAQVVERMLDPQVLTMQVRLTDRFGDNGLIAVLIARISGCEAEIETWLMSCRVLGRRVEDACLNVLAALCRGRGMKRLNGCYTPTQKNGIVRDLYRRIGFTRTGENEDGTTRWSLDITCFEQLTVPVTVVNNFEQGEVLNRSITDDSMPLRQNLSYSASHMG